MNKILLLAVLLLAAVNGIAQNRGLIKGKITDPVNNEPVKFATVAVLDMRDDSAVAMLFGQLLDISRQILSRTCRRYVFRILLDIVNKTI